MSARVDRETFGALQRSAGAAFVSELVGTFLEEAPAMIAGLREALAAGQPDRFRRLAHSLKSNGSTFGATSLAALARELELGGLERAAASPDPLGPLLREYEAVAAELAELRRG